MTKAFIIAAQSADGFIAKDAKHPAYWTSKEDKKRFIELTKQAGVVVMGSATFETIGKPLKERTNIVYSRSAKHFEGAETTHEEPQALLKRLAGQGVKEVAICGGSHIYTLFLKAHLVDKIYLTIEPVIFGKGITLFNEELNMHLQLVSAEQTESGAILLEYNVNYHGGKLAE
jgi:dihydrofolate reductase